MRDTELMEAFLAEAGEHLATVEDDVLAVERGEADTETINHLFRALHTVKGGSSLLDLRTITSLAHDLENVVGKLRDGSLRPDEEITDALLRGIDKLKLLLADTEDDSLPIEEEAALLQGLLAPRRAPPAPKPTPTPTPAPEPLPGEEDEPDSVDALVKAFTIEMAEHLASAEGELGALEADDGDQGSAPAHGRRLKKATHKIKAASTMMGLEEVAALASSLEAAASTIEAAESGAPVPVDPTLRQELERLTELLSDPSSLAPPSEPPPARGARGRGGHAPVGAVTPPQVKAVPEPPPAATPRHEPAPAPESSVRISISLLDKLMNLASELVLVRNQNKQAVENGDLQQLATIAQRLNVVTSDLQAGIMQTRMRPMSTAFGRFTRFVRDVARRLGKEVDLEIIGAEVELDKSIIEAINDPMTHLVRNALDHGIEAPHVRQQKGKLPRGRVTLSAYHQAGQVNIRIQDDGKGMDPWALKEAAMERGLITRAQAAAMSEREAFNLVFRPGFSLADEVTDISGRGVGMDVVKDAFKDLGGVIDISSTVGQGTTVTIKLPLTLAIVPALIVTVEDGCFAIPQVNIDEVVWLHGEEVYQSLQLVDDQEVYWLRGKLLPILRLSRILGIERGGERRAERPDRRQDRDDVGREQRGGAADRRVAVDNSVNIVVLKLGIEQVGLLVDSVIDTEEIVVKDLHQQLKSCGAFAGSTVLGDGKIAMILDMTSLLDLGALRLSGEEPTMRRSSSSSSGRQTVLLFDGGGRNTFAVPLTLINRVEEVRPDRVQWANGREYLSFRDSIMPLIRLEQAGLITDPAYRDELLYVIVPRSRRPVGVLAANILDTANVNVEIDSETISRPGVVGSAMVDGDLTLFVDLYRIVELVEPEWFAAELATTRSARRVLLLEDTAFYATLIIPQLRNAGLEVVHVPNGQEALDRLEQERFDVVVSDLEMPVMGGLEFAERVRADPRFRDLPMFAMSSMKDESVDAMAQRAGFDGFQSKLDQQALLEKLALLGTADLRRGGR